jgi:hypothetical protein
MTEKPLFEVFTTVFQFVGSGVAGGLIVLLFNHNLTISREGNAKRKRFRCYVELLIKKLEGTLIRDLAFDASGIFRDFKQFEMNVLDVRPYISDRKIGKFKDTCAAYKTIRFGAIGDPEKNAEAEKAKVKLISILGEISELSK